MLDAQHHRTDIRDVTVEQARPRPTWQARYEALQSRLFIDGQWVDLLNEKPMPPNTDSQLIDLLIQTPRDPESALARYEALCAGPLYDPFRHIWASSPRGGSKLSTPQLLGILALQELDRVRAERAFQALKDTPFYNRETKSWREGIDISPEGEVLTSTLDVAQDQLLDVLITWKDDPVAARDRYEALKRSAYDPVRECWKGGGEGVHAELFGILAEARVDLARARRLFVALRSQCFDAKSERWIVITNTGSPERVVASLELLAVYVEMQLDAPDDRSRAIVALPSLLDIH